ncbi:succinylglutamate desuccinylase/aspartoacylase domain-containing protein [Jiangella muralis]|uniref:succinylglutamate desuccinylase/aspartoacylase domain-containing protein n=1 Tax=Jiangella muralis TaxID=702383 RepID=UPI00069D5AEB|nr:succinylglutamate desuccinylase/aspartoacylase family protein [Jiangella muralis]
MSSEQQPAIVHEPAEIDWDRPGKHHYQVAFPLDGSWGYSLVPLTVINGRRGRSADNVLVVGGTHGNEWEGQVAVAGLCRDLDPDQLAGRVVLIPRLSESACAANSRWSPLDGVNMNRAFPGEPAGSVSYRIAHFVTSSVFPVVRVVVDIHSGGRDTRFPHVASFHPVADLPQRREMAEVATLFDTAFVMIYSSDMASGLLTDEAEAAGKITIGTEFGYGESVDRRGVQHGYEGVRNVLRHYRLLAEPVVRIDPERAAPARFIEAATLDGYLPAPRDGVWEPLIDPGDDVRAGQVVGRLHDFSSQVSSPLPIHAPRDGVVLMLHYPAVTTKGQTLFSVGQEVPF